MRLRLLLAVGLCTTAAALPLAARDLTVVLRGGTLADTMRTSQLKPFTDATQVAVHDDTWDGGTSLLRSRVESGSNSWDVVLVAAEELLAGCDDGLFEKLDWGAIGGKEHYLPQAVSDCGVGAAAFSYVLSWDRDKFTGVPTWSDFWDVARYPGKRGLRRAPQTSLEIALMADGVAPGDVYRLLRTDDGIERAFRKLDQIKPYVEWWQMPSQAAQILGSGEVLLSTAPNTRIAAANQVGVRHFGVQWAGSLSTVQSWVVMKGSPNLADATKLLAFMGEPARQAALAPTGWGPLAKGALEGLPPDQVALSPTSPANLAAGLLIDTQFWRDNGDKLTQRFEAWLAR